MNLSIGTSLYGEMYKHTAYNTVITEAENRGI